MDFLSLSFGEANDAISAARQALHEGHLIMVTHNPVDVAALNREARVPVYRLTLRACQGRRRGRLFAPTVLAVTAE